MKLIISFVVVLILGFLTQLYFFPELLQFTKTITSSHKNVCIVGGGLAGLSAAIEASQNKRNTIHIFEKEEKLGGNSQKATSGINGIATSAQLNDHVKDTYEIFFKDTINSGKGKCDEELVRKLVEKSTSAVSFLESFGTDLTTLSQCGGHSRSRTHRSDPNKIRFNVGGHIIYRLIETIKEIKNIMVRLERRITKITKVGSKLNLTYTRGDTETFGNLLCDKVIMTSGGFSASSEFLEKFAKNNYKQFGIDISVFPSTNGKWSTGDGIPLLNNLGADFIDMKEIQVHPTGLMSKDMGTSKKVFLAPEALRGSGGLLFKQNGERFVNELATRDVVTDALLTNCVPMPEKFGSNKRSIAILVLNQESAEKFGISKINFYKQRGFVEVYNGAEELCDAEGFELDFFIDTLNNYRDSYNGRKKVDRFGKKIFPVLFDLKDTFYRMYVTPSVHYTMGGVKINDNAEVLDMEGNVIKNLYAAGEVTGGVHGKNRLGGNSLLECVVFGRIAGKSTLN